MSLLPRVSGSCQRDSCNSFKMDAGNFYGARNPSCRSRGTYDYDYSSDLISEAVTTQRHTAGMIQVNQKLDRLLGMSNKKKQIHEDDVSKRPQRLPLKLSVSN